MLRAILPILLLSLTLGGAARVTAFEGVQKHPAGEPAREGESVLSIALDEESVLLSWTDTGGSYNVYRIDGESDELLRLTEDLSLVITDILPVGGETKHRLYRVTAMPDCPFDGDLIAYYPLMNNGRDASGNEYHGTPGGATGPATDRLGRAGYAMHFDNGLVDCGNPEQDVFDVWTGDASIGAWIRLDAHGPPPGSWVDAIIAKDDHQGMNNRKWIFGVQSNSLSFHINGPGYGSGIWIYSDAIAWELDTWYHAALTKSGTGYTFYLDGVDMGTRTLAQSVYVSGAPLTIAYSEPCCYLTGDVDEVYVIGRWIDAGEAGWMVDN